MNSTLIYPKSLNGSVTVPSSKSVLHRAVICACLSDEKSVITNVKLSDDIKATINAVNAMGRYAHYESNTITAGGALHTDAKIIIDCGESGSTLRFLLPIAGALGLNAEFTGKGRLPERPLNEYMYILAMHGMDLTPLSDKNLPLSTGGKLLSGLYNVRGNISSQYITGLLLSLPLLDGDSVIEIKSGLESKGYVDLTIDILKHYGVNIAEEANKYYIKGGQRYKACDYKAEGDYSSAAFFLCAGALGGDVSVSGLNINSKQGDKEIIDILKRFGANVTVSDDTVRVNGGELKGIEIDASQIPDLVPVLASVGAYAKGATIIKNAARLRLKESDRLSAMAQNLKKIGADVRELPDSLIINGSAVLKGGNADGFNDHRIVMAMSIAALRTENGINISGSESINKSYPEFFSDFLRLGGVINGF